MRVALDSDDKFRDRVPDHTFNKKLLDHDFRVMRGDGVADAPRRRFSRIHVSFIRPCRCAASSAITRSAAEMKRTFQARCVASSPNAIARCVLPTPLGPNRTTFSAGDPGQHLTRSQPPGIALALQNLFQEVGVARVLALRGTLGHRAVQLGQRVQPQLMRQRFDALVLQRRYAGAAAISAS